MVVVVRNVRLLVGTRVAMHVVLVIQTAKIMFVHPTAYVQNALMVSTGTSVKMTVTSVV